MNFQIIKILSCKFVHPRLAYLSVIGGFLVQLTLGGVYTYGNMAPYMLAYMSNHTEPLGKITVGNSIWIFCLSIFGLGASMSLGGWIELKLGTPGTILFGSWIMSFGVLVTYWTIKVHLALVAISYGLVVGLGIGIAYGVILSVPCEWFPKNKGFVTGIVLSGFALGPFSFDFLQSIYINTDIYAVKLHDTSRVPSSFLVFGSIYGIIQFVGSLIIRRPVPVMPEDYRNEEPHSSSFNSIVASEIEPDNYINFKPHQLIFERDFWILWITYVLNSVVVIMILSLHKIFGVTLNMNDRNLTIISVIGAFCNGFGRILWGYLNDRISYKVLMSILSLSMSLMVGTFYMCALVGNTGSTNDINRIVMYCFWVIVLYFLLSGNFTLFPTICAQAFGSQYFTGNYGVLFTGYSFAGIITGAVTTNLLETGNNYGSYLAPFLVCSGFSLLSSGLTLFYRGKSLLLQPVLI